MSTNNLPVQAQTQAPIQVGLTDSQSFELAQRVAKCFAMSTLVPKDYQNNLPNCVIALNMASRMGADPMMVMQNLYVVHGRPAWSAQFLIATFNKNGRFSSLRYKQIGEPGKDSFGYIAVATELATGEPLEGTAVTIELAKKNGWWNKKDRNGNESSKWPFMTDQMLRYRAASWFIRAYAPEIAMGLQTAEEVRDTYELERDGETFSLPPKGQTSSDLNAMLHAEPETILVPVAEPSEPAVAEPVQTENGNGKKRPTAVELEEMRADMVDELADEGLALAEIEKAVGAYSNTWTPKHIEKIRGVIVPNLKAELMGA